MNKITYNKDDSYPKAGIAMLEHENHAALEPRIILNGKNDNTVAMHAGMNFKNFLCIIDKTVYFSVKIIHIE